MKLIIICKRMQGYFTYKLMKDENNMKLKFNKNGDLSELVQKETIVDWDKVKDVYYDIKQLEEWEKRFDQAMEVLKGANKMEGLELLNVLVEEGYPEAMRELSNQYIIGEVVTESFSKAVEWDYRARHAERLFLGY